MSIFALRSNGLASSAYKNLSSTQSNLNSNIGRLSSGLRINSTADDSAGSNVSVRMSNQVRGMSQANRNAQDANNLLATAESGLSDISNVVSKMRELAVQASTDTLNDADRASINLEFQSLKDEFTRIANVTEYNGMNLLNGTYQEATDDGVTNSDDAAVTWAGTGPESLFNVTNNSNTVSSSSYTVAELSMSEEYLSTWVYSDGSSRDAIAGLQTGDQVVVSGTGTSLDGVKATVVEIAGEHNLDSFKIEHETLSASDQDSSGLSGSFQTFASEAIYDQEQPGTSDGSNPHGTSDVANYAGHGTLDGIDDNQRGHWRLQIGADNDINNQHEFSITNTTANGLDLEDEVVLSVDDARDAITALDHAIDELNRERSYIGSEQNKLQFTMSNLTSNIQSIEAARSSIEDVDFAAEAADLAKNQILAQSGTAMLAQAAAVSQNILGLLA